MLPWETQRRLPLKAELVTQCPQEEGTPHAMQSPKEKHPGGQEAGMRAQHGGAFVIEVAGWGCCVEVSLVREQNRNVGVCRRRICNVSSVCL